MGYDGEDAFIDNNDATVSLFMDSFLYFIVYGHNYRLKDSVINVSSTVDFVLYAASIMLLSTHPIQGFLIIDYYPFLLSIEYF